MMHTRLASLLSHVAAAFALAVSAAGCVLDDVDDDSQPVAACPELAVECADGSAPIDADGDGCALECAGDGDAVVCPAIAVECADGSAPIDADGDGCALECAGDGDAVVCPAIAVECADGSAPIDADGDGCALECVGA
jgi:hypothetical protein